MERGGGEAGLGAKGTGLALPAPRPPPFAFGLGCGAQPFGQHQHLLGALLGAVDCAIGIIMFSIRGSVTLWGC